MVVEDPINGPHPLPNSICFHKIPESPLVEYTFNNCGYRAENQTCGPKQVGTYRIALVGTSIAEGLDVPWNQTFAAMLPKELSRRSGRRIELYDEASEWESPRLVSLRFKRTLADDPDLILWPLTVWDIENASLMLPSKVPVASGSPLKRAWERIRRETTGKPPAEATTALLRHFFEVVLPGTTFMINHYASENRYEFLMRSFQSDTNTGYLKVKCDSEWMSHVREFDRYATEVQDRAKAAGVTLIVTLLPTHAQAELISQGNWPVGFDPYQLGKQVRSVVEKHGGQYIDLLGDFSSVSNVGQDFYPVDGHPNAKGQSVISALLSRKLVF